MRSAQNGHSYFMKPMANNKNNGKSTIFGERIENKIPAKRNPKASEKS